MTKIIIVSGPVIVKDNKVLLDKSGADDFWKFCGGKSIEGENLIDTAKRRAKEELGISVNVINPVPFLMHINKNTDDENMDVILVHWLSNYSGEIKPGEDIREWKCLDLSDLPDNLGPNIIPALKHFKLI